MRDSKYLWTALRYAALLLFATAAHAQSYPNKPIRVVVAFAPGGPADLAVRPLNTKLSEYLGKPVVIEFKSGATAVLGTDYVAKSPPDGYTLLLVTSAQLALPATTKSLPFDLIRDFSGVGNFATSGLVLVVNPALKINSVEELIKYAKSSGKSLNFGSSGYGGAVHLSMEYFLIKSSVQGLHVPFKGVGPALQEVIAGRLDAMFGGMSGVAPFAKSGKLKMLAIGGAKRSRLAPDLPTVAESTKLMEKFAVDSSYGLVGPAKMSPTIASRLNAEIKKAVETSEVEKAFENLGIEPWWRTPADTAVWVAEEVDKWVTVAKSINYVPE